MKTKLAINGGTPVRNTMLPYGRQQIDDDDIAAVTAVLRSDWLTTGPGVGEFESAFAAFTGAAEAVAVSNGTAALHAAMFALDIGPGDEVIVPALTFAASANCVVYQGGTPVFADVQEDTLLLDVVSVESKITPRTKAIVAVDYAGQPCDYQALHKICKKYDLALVADACHSLGAHYQGKSVGTLADLSCFSLHPVKPMTTGEGGMITTDSPELAAKMRAFRSHGITTDHRQREMQGSWFYEMMDLGYNYRLTDFQCALGLSQLQKLDVWVERRRWLAQQYDIAFSTDPRIVPLVLRPERTHAYHLYVIRLATTDIGMTRADVFAALRAEGIGVNVHYVPVHLHPFYRDRFDTGPGLCPMAEQAYEQILTLPLFPQMTEMDVNDVVTALEKVLQPLG